MGVAAICLTLPNFLCLGVDKHLGHTWRMYRLINMLASWGILLCLFWVDDYYWDFWPITTIQSYTFRLGGSIERAWPGDLTRLNGFLGARTLWIAGSLVYGSSVCRALGISMDFWISGFGGSSGNVRGVRRTNASIAKFMWGWVITGARFKLGHGELVVAVNSETSWEEWILPR